MRLFALLLFFVAWTGHAAAGPDLPLMPRELVMITKAQVFPTTGAKPAAEHYPAATGVVRGADIAPWALLVAPTALLGAFALFPALPPGARNPFQNVLLVTGLLSAVWGGLMALRTPEPARYGRVLIADLALGTIGGPRHLLRSDRRDPAEEDPDVAQCPHQLEHQCAGDDVENVVVGEGFAEAGGGFEVAQAPH